MRPADHDILHQRGDDFDKHNVPKCVDIGFFVDFVYDNNSVCLHKSVHHVGFDPIRDVVASHNNGLDYDIALARSSDFMRRRDV